MSFAQDSDGNWGYKVGADSVVPFKNGGAKYIEALSIRVTQTDKYYVYIDRSFYDPNGIGDQKLLSANGRYDSGWIVQLIVSDKASYCNYKSGYLINRVYYQNKSFVVIATIE